MQAMELELKFFEPKDVSDFSIALNEKRSSSDGFRKDGFNVVTPTDEQNFDPVSILLMLKLLTALAGATGATFAALLAFLKFVRYFQKSEGRKTVILILNGHQKTLTSDLSDADLERICNEILAGKK